MNYQEMESLFRTEQLALGHELRLNPAAVDLRAVKKKWWIVRMSAGRMTPGGWADKIMLVVSLAIAFMQPGNWLSFLPLIVSSVALMFNINVFPFRPLPSSGLERFTTAGLAEEISRLRKYIVKRNTSEMIFYGLWLISFLVWYYSYLNGVNLILEPAIVGTRYWKTMGFSILAFIVFGNLLTWNNLRQLAIVEKDLRGYFEDEYV